MRNSTLFSLWLLLSVMTFSSLAQKELRVYRYQSADGVVSFSDREPENTSFVEIACYACQVDSLVDWQQTKLFPKKYNDTILKAAVFNDIDPAFIRAIIHAESHFKANAVSKKGAQGLMQLMPATAKSLGVRNGFNAKDNIQGGAKHLARLLKKYRGNMTLAAAAYNAGEGAVKKYNGIPPYSETKVYVKRVAILYKRYKTAT